MPILRSCELDAHSVNLMEAVAIILTPVTHSRTTYNKATTNLQFSKTSG